MEETSRDTEVFQTFWVDFRCACIHCKLCIISVYIINAVWSYKPPRWKCTHKLLRREETDERKRFLLMRSTTILFCLSKHATVVFTDYFKTATCSWQSLFSIVCSRFLETGFFFLSLYKQLNFMDCTNQVYIIYTNIDSFCVNPWVMHKQTSAI